jgi:hypothetical protein
VRYAVLPFAAVMMCACGGTGASTGTHAGDGGSAVQSYTPEGCRYTVSPPSSLGYEAMALDDTTTPVDKAKGQPSRVRVGLGGGTVKGQPGYADPTTTAAFLWETDEPNHAAKVKLGTSAGALSQVQGGYTWAVHPILGSQDAYFHEVHVCGLTPATTYFYQVGGGPSGSEVWSATQSFTTMPSGGTITVGFFGDARDQMATWQSVHLRMRGAGVLMSLVDGDVVDIGALEPLYTQWLDAIWKDPNDSSKFLTLGQQYILPINGNHENDTSTSFANWSIPGDGPYAKTYASFDLGSAHVTMIDDTHIATCTTPGACASSSTEPSALEASAQLAWIERDLQAAAADRSIHPFVVVMNHRGLYSTADHATDPDVIATRGLLAPLFDKYGVNLVLNGHDHEYERTAPIQAGSPPSGDPMASKQGTTYVICAGAGADARPVGATPVAWRLVQAAYGAGTPYIGTYALLTIAPTQLTLKAYGMKASSTTVSGDDVIDTVTLLH